MRSVQPPEAAATAAKAGHHPAAGRLQSRPAVGEEQGADPGPGLGPQLPVKEGYGARGILTPTAVFCESTHAYPMDTGGKLPKQAHTKHMQIVPHTHSAHRRWFPLQVAEAPTPVLRGASQAWTSLPLCFPASDGTSKGGTTSGKPQLKAATREGSGE